MYKVQPMLDCTLAKINNMNSVDGKTLSMMKESIVKDGGEAMYCGAKTSYSQNVHAEFQTLKADYLRIIQKNIKNRFPKKDIDIFDNLNKLLEPMTDNETTDAESEDALSHLANFYGYEKRVSLITGCLGA